MNEGHFWLNDGELLIREWNAKPVDQSLYSFCVEWHNRYQDVSVDAVKCKIRRLILEGKIQRSQPIPESPYPVYNEPLEMTGDALILPDIELPFHHADFVNRCLAVAEKWGIQQCILGGDIVHLDALSSWEKNFKGKEEKRGLSDRAEAELVEFAKGLGKRQQERFFSTLSRIDESTEHDGVSGELEIARDVLRRLGQQFEHIDCVVGNHEGRLLRALETALDVEEIKRLLELGDRWRIAPYYFSHLISGGKKYAIEHPKTAARLSAADLAAKYQCNVIMCHSHLFMVTNDISGQFFAASIGCCVDEERLPYAAQRHNRGPAHMLGAAIVRDGWPTILTKFTDWERL